MSPFLARKSRPPGGHQDIKMGTCAWWPRGSCNFGNRCSFLHAFVDPEKRGICMRHLRGECYFTAEGCFYSHIPCSIAKYEEFAKGTKNFRELKTKLEQNGFVWNRRTTKFAPEESENGNGSIPESKNRAVSFDNHICSPALQNFKNLRITSGHNGKVDNETWYANSSLFSTREIFSVSGQTIPTTQGSSLWKISDGASPDVSSGPSVRSSGSSIDPSWPITKAQNSLNGELSHVLGYQTSSVEDWGKYCGPPNGSVDTISSAGSTDSKNDEDLEREPEEPNVSPKEARVDLSESRECLPEAIGSSASDPQDDEKTVPNEGKIMAEWDCNEVFEFIKEIGDHKCWEQYATKLRDEEVDGLTLKVYVNFNDIIEDYPGIKKGHARVLAGSIRRRLG
eukprot:jgi/Bigna1/71719/fgenesh1_pg.16_\